MKTNKYKEAIYSLLKEYSDWEHPFPESRIEEMMVTMGYSISRVSVNRYLRELVKDRLIQKTHGVFQYKRPCYQYFYEPNVNSEIPE